MGLANGSNSKATIEGGIITTTTTIFEDETYWEPHLKYEKVAFMLLDRFDDVV